MPWAMSCEISKMNIAANESPMAFLCTHFASTSTSDTVRVTAIPALHLSIFEISSVTSVTRILFAVVPILTQRGISLYSAQSAPSRSILVPPIPVDSSNGVSTVGKLYLTWPFSSMVYKSQPVSVSLTAILPVKWSMFPAVVPSSNHSPSR